MSNNYNFSDYQSPGGTLPPQGFDPNAQPPTQAPAQSYSYGQTPQDIPNTNPPLPNLNNPSSFTDQAVYPQNYGTLPDAQVPSGQSFGGTTSQNFIVPPGGSANVLIQNGEEPKKFDLRRFLPFIIIGIIGVIVLIIVLSLLFGNKSTNTNTSSEKIVLQWWGVFMKPAEVQPLIDEYQAQNPNVTIEYANKWPDNSDYSTATTKYKGDLDRVLKAADPVQIPDIYMVQNTWAGDYERFSKSSSTYTATTFGSTFYPAASKDFAHGGTVYGMPLWMDDFAVLYNKDLLASNAVLNVPTDWPTFLSLAQNLTKKDSSGKIKIAGFAAGTDKNTSFGFDLANILLFQNGVSMTDTTDKANFSTDPDTVSTLQFFKNFESGSGATWDDTLGNDSAEFLQGNVAMIIAPSYRLREILYYNDQYGLNLNIGVAQLPQLQGQDQAVINFPDYWGNMVALNRPNADASWQFLNWLSQPDQLKKLSDNIKTTEGYFGILYPRTDMSTELSTDQYLKIYNDSLPFLKTWYMVKGVEVRTDFDAIINQGSISQGTITQLESQVQTLQSAKGQL